MGNPFSSYLPDDDAVEHLFRLEKWNQITQIGWPVGFRIRICSRLALYPRDKSEVADSFHAVLSRARSGWDEYPKRARRHIQPLDDATTGKELEATAPARIFFRHRRCYALNARHDDEQEDPWPRSRSTK